MTNSATDERRVRYKYGSVRHASHYLEYLMRSSCFQDVCAVKYTVSSYLPAAVIYPLPTVMPDLPTTQHWSTQWRPGASITKTTPNGNYESHCNLSITYCDARFTDHTTLVHAVVPGGEYHSDYP